MAKIQTTTVQKIEEERTNGDPVAVVMKNFLLEGMDPAPGELDKYEINVKCQKLDRGGRVIQGVALRTSNLLTLTEEILDDEICGPGIYNVYVQYRPQGETRDYSLVTMKGIRFSDGMDHRSYELSPRVENPTEGGGSNLLALVMQSMQESNKLMMHSMQENSKLMVQMMQAVAGGNKSNISDVLDAVQAIDEMRGGDGGPIEGEEENPNQDVFTQLMQFAGPVFGEILKKIASAETPEAREQAAAELQRQLTAGQQPHTPASPLPS